jgi:hypothetical protein
MSCELRWGNGYHMCIRPDNHDGAHMCGCAATFNAETGDECE